MAVYIWVPTKPASQQIQGMSNMRLGALISYDDSPAPCVEDYLIDPDYALETYL